MAHLIMKKDSLMYAGEKPWHGIGKYVGNDVVTASEAILAAKLDWEVQSEPIYDKEGEEINNYRGIVRQDTRDVLNIATERYTPIQNVECFKIFDEVTKTGMAKYEVAGSLKNGRKIWILARVPKGDFSIKKVDDVKAYLLLTSSHDGSLGLQMFETPIRVVCNNTLTAAVAERKNEPVARFKHTMNYRSKITDAQIVLKSVIQYFISFKEAAEFMAKKEMDSLKMDSFLDTLLQIDDKEKEVSARALNQKSELERLFVSGTGNSMEQIKRTNWAMFNAVTEYVDHTRSTKGEEDNRIDSSWFGSGGKLRQRAFELLTV